ncbi:MAG: HlyC/CorC family transporter [Candidatus Eutrophobiaceae bacterium]
MIPKEANTHSIENWLDGLKRLFQKSPEDRNDIVDVLREAESNNLIEPDILHIVEGALTVSELRVGDVMVPRTAIVSVRSHQKPSKIVRIITESGHSRFPVFDELGQKVEGLVLAKDLLRFLAPESQGQFSLDEIMRPAQFIPESKRLNVLLREMRNNRNHMVIVIDEYSEVIGLITIEDILEEIIGEIVDEHDHEEDKNIISQDGGYCLVKGVTLIEEFNMHFSAHLSDTKYETISGLLIHLFGHVPMCGRSLQHKGFEFFVRRADQRKINLLRVKRADSVAGEQRSTAAPEE